MPRMTDPRTLVGPIIGKQSGMVRVAFDSGPTRLMADVPVNELWVEVKDVLVFEEYEYLPSFRLSNLQVGSTVVDVGAYAGTYSLKSSPFASRVIAFEPSRRNIQLLRRNLNLNASKNIEARQVALSSRAGYVAFPDLETGTSFSAVHGAASTPSSYQVPSISMDDLTDEIGVVDLMKMDIEGMEYDAILAASSSTLRKVRRLVAEIHLPSASSIALLGRTVAHLKKAGKEVTVVRSAVGKPLAGLLKPWACSLVGFEQGSSLLFKAYLSAVYGFPLSMKLVSVFDVGTTGLLFAKDQGLGPGATRLQP